MVRNGDGGKGEVILTVQYDSSWKKVENKMINPFYKKHFQYFAP
jgi:hypothetical protein